jgi:DNA (cytosine-5)-methyltransferase 1
VTTMASVEAATGTNGLTVASIFAGCGGSSIGYRLAGFDVTYACEWDAEPAATYALNNAAVPDQRDVRELTATDVGTVDVLDGSPPCQDFSTVGPRNVDGTRAALYYEFVRLVGEVRPRAFAAENVVGFAQGPMRARHFLPILRMLRSGGYSVEARTLDASWLGAPQARKRVVLIGLRNDVGVAAADAFPRRERRQTVIADALPDVARIVKQAGSTRWFARDGRVANEQRSVTRQKYKWSEESVWPATGPAPTITKSGMAAYGARDITIETVDGEQAPPTVVQLKALCGFPRDFEFADEIESPWWQLGNSVLPPMARAWASQLAAILG